MTSEASLALEFSRRSMAYQAGGSSAARPSSAETENPLAAYFSSHKEGRGIWKWSHYFEIYDRHLAKFVGRDAHVVEIGIYSGGSLEMWRHYFGPACRVTGIDVQEACRAYADERISIVIGDQADREFWRIFREQALPVDVLIDDGGHTYEQQRITLEEMLPHLKPGGVYLCEDVHGVGNQLAAYTHALSDQLNAFDAISAPRELATVASSFQRAIRSIHFYPFAVVIEKAERPVDGFVAPRQGSEWEPFMS